MWLLGQPVCLAGQPDTSQMFAQRQYIGDVVQTVQEQGIPAGDLVMQLLLAVIKELGPVKALLWLAMLPLLTVGGVLFGAIKVFQRRG